MPDSRVGEQSMSFPLRGEVTGSSCPFFHFNTALCSLTWDAVVRFEKTGVREVEADPDELHVPITPPEQKPVTPPSPDDDLLVPLTPPKDDDLLVPLVEDLLVPLVAKAKLARNLSSATLPVTCAARCSGTAVATAGGATLSKGRFTAPAGRTVVSKLRFDARDRRAIKRAGGVRVAVKARAGGRQVVQRVVLRTTV